MPEGQRPTVGRIVLFEPATDDSEAKANGLAPGEKLPAVIVRVREARVNLRVFTDGEAVPRRTSVPFGSGSYTWNWPPRE